MNDLNDPHDPHASIDCILVIIGASGDLTRRKLLPALYNLSRGQRLPARFSVVGVAREKMADDGMRSIFSASLREFAGLQQVLVPDRRRR